MIEDDVEIKNNKYQITRSVSFVDLRNVGYDIELLYKEKAGQKTLLKYFTRFKGKIDNKLDSLNKLCWHYGCDTVSFPINMQKDILKCKHRSLNGDEVDDYMLILTERSDREWVSSIHASQEAIARSSRMTDMGSTLHKLSQGMLDVSSGGS